jgi:hypothetical protein
MKTITGLILALATALPLTISAQTSLSADEKKLVISSEYLASAGIKIPAVPQVFKHPALLNNLAELTLVRQKIEAKEEPWYSAFETMKATPWASLKYKPKPHKIVQLRLSRRGWGSAGGSDDQGRDAIAAYTQALMWIFTGDGRHAAKAAEILNAWSI